MKNRVLTFIIGMLVGALVATGGFFIYSKVATPARGGRPMMGQMGQPPEMPEGMNGRGSGMHQGQPQNNNSETAENNA